MRRPLINLPVVLSLLVCISFFGCSDEKTNEEEKPNISESFITLTEFDLPLLLEEIQATTVHLNIKNLKTGEIFKEETTLIRFATYVQFILKTGLSDGDFMFLNALCYPANNEPVYEASMGMTASIRGGQLELISTYNEDLGFYGSGTYDDPYVIASVKDLNRLKKHVNGDYGNTFSGFCFRLQQDLNLISQDYTTGWEPIASRSSTPFCGVFDGGGYEIEGLWVNTPGLSGKGLFGFSLGATFRNITLVSPEIKTDGYSGALLGVAFTEGKTRMQTLVENCKIIKGGTINGEVGMGALIGAVDQVTMLKITNCSNNANVTASIGAGGLIGSAVISSRIMVDSCSNHGTIRATNGSVISGVGGIVGVSDTLTITRSTNSGSIYSPDYADAKGIGGLVGSSGFGLFALCSNTGAVSGGRGVGGILGSTVVEMEDVAEDKPATYNSATFTGCSNQGEVKAYRMAGGIVGESQALINACYNISPVTATENYAGGIIGIAPTLIVQNCLNSGRIKGNAYTGGIAAASYFNQIVGSYNFGEINTSGKDAVIGGIIGHSGNNTALHYCGNYGLISHSGTDGAAGGITGQLGNVRTFSAFDICNLVFTSVSMVLAPIEGVVDVYSYLLLPANVVSKTCKAFEIVGYVEQAIGFSFDLHDVTHWFIPGDPRENAPELNVEQISEQFKTAVDQVATEKQNVFNKELGLFNQRNNNTIPLNSKVIESQEGFCTKLQQSGDYFTQVNKKLHEYKEARYEALVDGKQGYSLAMDILNGVMIALGVAAFVVGLVATGGSGVAVLATIASVVIGTIGGSGGLAQTARDFEENASVIHQCFNQGNLNITDTGVFGGGITGKLNDYGEISDCFNTGTLNQKENNRKGGITGFMGDKISVNSTVNYAQWSNPKYGSTIGAADPEYSKNHCKVYYLNDRQNNNGGRTSDQMMNPDTFKGFLNSQYWTLDQEGSPVHTSISLFE